MRLSRIARGNMRRHLSRTILLVGVIAVAVGIVTTLYLVTQAAEQDLADRVDEYGANIVVVPRSDELPRAYGGVDLGGSTGGAGPFHMRDAETIRGIDASQNINVVAPKLVELSTIEGQRYLVVGVQWDQELALKKWWDIRGSQPATGSDLLVGSGAARKLDLSPGDPVQVRDESLRVAGILGETGGSEDDLVFADLGTVQRLWDREGEVSFFEVSAWCSTCPIELINAQISAELPNARVSAVLKAAESRELLIGRFESFGALLSALMVSVGGLIVLSTTLGSVRDRRREIGIFRAVGYRRRHIFNVILMENLGLAVLGGALGIALALAAYGPTARGLASVQELIVPGPLDLVFVFLVALAVVAGATVYPAWKASQLSPTLAMREV